MDAGMCCQNCQGISCILSRDPSSRLPAGSLQWAESAAEPWVRDLVHLPLEGRLPGRHAVGCLLVGGSASARQNELW